MSVLLLTVFIGGVLVMFFICMFLRDAADPRGSSERDALLPLATEKSRSPKIAQRRAHSHQSHD